MLFLSCSSAADPILEIKMLELSAENLISNSLLSVFLHEKIKKQQIIEANFKGFVNI